MIGDKEIAKLVSDLMLDCGRRIDESIAIVEKKCTPEEFRVYRQAAGKIMGSILLEVLNPLYDTHADLKPSAMR